MKILQLALILSTLNLVSQENKNITITIPYCDVEWKDEYIQDKSLYKFYEKKEYLITNFEASKDVIKSTNKELRFLISGLDFPEGFSVEGRWINRKMYPGETILFSVKNVNNEEKSKGYQIYVKGKIKEITDNKFPFFSEIKDYELRVASGINNESLVKMDLKSFPSGGFEGGIYLYWIGDLNGDDKLDIIAGESSHFAGIELILFLSNNSKEKLFKKLKVGGCSSC